MLFDNDFIKGFFYQPVLNILSVHKFADSYYVTHYICHIATTLVHSFHGQSMHE